MQAYFPTGKWKKLQLKTHFRAIWFCPIISKSHIISGIVPTDQPVKWQHFAILLSCLQRLNLNVYLPDFHKLTPHCMFICVYLLYIKFIHTKQDHHLKPPNMLPQNYTSGLKKKLIAEWRKWLLLEVMFVVNYL